jgi:Putative transposase
VSGLAHRLQLLPQPALPEVPGTSTDPVACRPKARELLPVPYFHVVFTVPAPIGAMAFQNKAVVYAILFKAAAEALTTLAANPRRLGAEIGAVAVLHTWGQALTHHPHLHLCRPGPSRVASGR